MRGHFALLGTYSSRYLLVDCASPAPPRLRLPLRQWWTRFCPYFAHTWYLRLFPSLGALLTHFTRRFGWGKTPNMSFALQGMTLYPLLFLGADLLLGHPHRFPRVKVGLRHLGI